MYALRLNSKYYCVPNVCSYPSGWQEWSKCAGIYILEDQQEMEISLNNLRSLGGSYRDMELVKLSEQQLQDLVVLKLADHSKV